MPENNQKARVALAIAASFLNDVAAKIDKGLDGKDFAWGLNTTSIAAKKITEAERLDPNAYHTFPKDGDEEPIKLTIAELKTLALYYEGTIEYLNSAWLDRRAKEAITALKGAIRLNPSPLYYYRLGQIHTALKHKPQAIQALNKAIELDPDNINYYKQLELAKAITGAQIFYEGAAKAGNVAVGTSKVLFGLFILLGFFVMGMGIYSFPSPQTIPLIFGGLVLQVIALGIFKIIDFFN